MQRARNRCSAHSDDVHTALELLQAFFVLDTEALFFIDDHKAQVLEIDVLRKQPMRADGDIDFAFGYVGDGLLQLLWGTKAAQHFNAYGEGLEATLERLEVLEGEDGGGREHGDLFAVTQGFEGGAHDYFSFAKADIAAEQAIHGLRVLHVALDLLDGGSLVLRLGKFEGVFEFTLPVAVAGKGEALRDLAGGVKFEQLLSHVAHFGFDSGLGASPGGAAE